MSAANVMLAIHEKKTTPTDLYRPLRLYIASAYSEREAAAADDDLAAVRDLRADVEQPSLPDPSSLERRRDALLAYARALSLVEPRFPISPDRSHVHSLTFTWHDAFKTSKKASVASIHLEKAAVLFNLGAVYSQIALAADRATDVGIRTACGSFQSAAGAFAWMRESGVAAKAVAAGATTVDVTPECAAMLEKLMLAQAQECFFEKVIAGGKPPALCSKVARQVGIFYEEAYAALSAAPLSQHFDKTWVSHVQLKAAQFYADACYRCSLDLHEKEEIAQEIARLKIGISALADAKKVARGVAAPLLDSVNKLESNMKTNLERAMEENDRVYLMRVPDASSLGPLPAAYPVKPTSLAAVLDASKERLFSSLVPDGSMKALSKYTEMVDNIIRTQVEKLQQASEITRVRLKEMELPNSILSLEGNITLPLDLKEDVEAVQISGGPAGLEAELQQHRVLSRVNRELLVQTEEMPQKEANEDAQCRRQFGSRWTRPQSSILTKNIQDRLNLFASNLKTAGDNDTQIERGLMESYPLMSILDRRPIESALPSISRPIMSLDGNEDAIVGALKQSLKQLESLGAHRAGLEDKLKEMKRKDDILPKLMTSVGSHDDLFKKEISKYDPVCAEIADNIVAQEQLLLQIQKAMKKAEADGNNDCPVKIKLVTCPVSVLTPQTLDKKFSSEEVEDILLHWTFDPNYRLPGNVYAIDLYTKDCFEDLEQYSQDGVACFVLQLTCIRNGTFNRRMGKKNYGWIQCDKGKEGRLMKKTFKYVEKFDSKKLTTNLKMNYMADRRMKEYTFESGPEDKVFCVVTSPEWCQALAPPSASSPAPSSQKEIEKLMTELRLVRDERDVFEREVVNLRSEIQRLKDDQREEVKALELKLASCDAKLKRSELTKMEIATEYEKQKQLLQSMQLQIEASEQLRKELHNTIIELKGNIRVLCRVRPLLPNETGAISFPKNEESIGRGVVVSHNARTYSFTFDRVFGPTSSQEAVFSEISEVVQSALDGYKVCIFAYGQSGSGKTHTMMGNPEEIGGKGLIPRSLEQIFQTSKALNSNGWKYVIKVKMVEIYNDSICDLLGSNSTTNLTTVVVSDVNEVFHHLKQAAKRRSVGRTDINEHSSRSHAIFMLVISGVNERTGKQVEGILNMIDLAGSERLEKSGATGDRLKESQAINKSLSSLSDVILAIVNGDSHVPFRNSKLTYLLQPYLGGDAKTLMLVTISQDVSSAQETISSLQFAALVNSCEIGNQNTRAGSVTRVSSVQRTLAVQRDDGVDVSSSALRRGSSNMYRTPSRVKFHPYFGAAAYRGGSSKINDTPSRINQAHLPIRIPEDQSVT